MSKKEKSKSARRLAREFAVQALYQWQFSEDSSDELFLQFETDHDFSAVDREYWQELVREILKSSHEIDENLKPFLTRAMSSVTPVELAVLRLSIYELSIRHEIPYRVIINEALELVKLFGADESHRFINGVLDAAAKKIRATEVAAHKRA